MVTFPIDLPATPGLVRMSLFPIVQTKPTKSPLSGKQKQISFDGDHWGLSFTLPIMSRAQAAPWQGKLASLRGSLGTFNFFDRYQEDILGAALDTARVLGGSQVGSIVNMSLLGVSVSKVFLTGDKIALPVSGTQDELKIITEDVDSDVSGEAAVPIWPPIIASPDSGPPIKTGFNAKGVFRLVTPSAFDVSSIGNYEITVNAIEAI